MADVLDHLTEEHRKVEQLLAELKETDPGDERQRLFDELRTSLGTHMAVEERFLYPILADVEDDEEAADATDEHELARAGLEEAAKRLEEGAFAAAIDVLEAGIGHHVSEEEEDQFPALREKAGDRIAALDPEVLEEVVESTKAELRRKAAEAGVEGRSKMDDVELAQALSDTP